MFGGEPGNQVNIRQAAVAEHGDGAVVGFGQVARGLQHPLQDGFELKALIDPQAGLAEPGQAVAQRIFAGGARLGPGHAVNLPVTGWSGSRRCIYLICTT